MRKLFISFITAILLTSCSADSLMKETELDLTDTEKVYSGHYIDPQSCIRLVCTYAHGKRSAGKLRILRKYRKVALYA